MRSSVQVARVLSAGAVCVLVAAGCASATDGSHGSAGRAHESSRAAHAAPGRAPGRDRHHRAKARPRPTAGWCATEGAPPSIAVENRAAGTTAWRLPGPAYEIGGVAHGAIAGYVAEQAIAPGEAQSVYVSAPGAHTVKVRGLSHGLVWGARRQAGAAERALARPETAAVHASPRHRADRVSLARDPHLSHPESAHERCVHRQAARLHGRGKRLPVRVAPCAPTAAAGGDTDGQLRGVQRVGRGQPVSGREQARRGHRDEPGCGSLLRPSLRQPDRRGAVLHPRGGDGALPGALRLSGGVHDDRVDRPRPRAGLGTHPPAGADRRRALRVLVRRATSARSPALATGARA